jgi:hypothetical protein
VALNLDERQRRGNRRRQMKKAIAAPDLRFFVQTYLPGGLELIMGAKAEEGLGHAVVFGLGGSYVEVMQDVVFNLTPVSAAEAREMLRGIKAAALLEGVRGRSRGQPGAARRDAAAALAAAHRPAGDPGDGPQPGHGLRRQGVMWWMRESALKNQP